MPAHGVPPMFLTVALLLCADPMTTVEVGEPTESRPLAEAVAPIAASAELTEDHDSSLEVFAASPLPHGHRAGSGYGYRTSGRTGRRTFHAGLDFMARRGTPVYAVTEGIVEHVSRESDRDRRFSGYGNAVVLFHPATDRDEARWTFYAHLDSVEVHAGEIVRPGSPLGAVGNTSHRRFRTMAPHLHFEVRHARTDGSSPFPGPYRHFNDDPERYLSALGVETRPPAPSETDAQIATARPALVMRRRRLIATRLAPPGLAQSETALARF